MEAGPAIDHPSRRLFDAARDYLRWLLLLLLVTAVIGLGLLYLMQAQLDEQIRAHLEARIRDHYQGLLVSVKSVRRLPVGGLEVRGLTISSPAGDTGPLLLAHADEMIVDCDTSLTNLLSNDRVVRQLIVRRLLIRPVRQPDGSWSTQQLLPLPKLGRFPPPARIESGVIEIHDPHGARPQRWVVRDVDAQLQPLSDDLDERRGADSQIGPGAETVSSTQRLSPRRRSSTTTAGAPSGLPKFGLRGRFVSDLLGQVEYQGRLDFSNGMWEVEGKVSQLRLSPEVVERLPASFADRFAALRPLRGMAHFDYRMSYDSTRKAPIGFVASGGFVGEVDDVRLPGTLRSVEFTFACDDRSLAIRQASGRLGQAVITGSCQRSGWGKTSPLRIKLRAERLQFDSTVRAALQGKWREQWDRFAPAGQIDANVDVFFDGTKWSHRVDVECHGCSFAYAAFPYRLTDVRGKIDCQDDQIRLESVQAFAAGRELQILGAVQNPGPSAIGWIEIHGADPIPIDERLIGALRGRQPNASRPGPRDVVAMLEPHGNLTVHARIGRDTAQQELQREVDILLHDCSVRYERFPYRIYGIRGKLSMRNDTWKVDDLMGGHDSGTIHCAGGWTADGLGGCNLHLDFDARDIPLQDELRDALNPACRRLWNQLQPRGTIDRLMVAVDYQSADQRLDVQVTSHKNPPSQNVAGRSITIVPSWFPYQLDELTGTLEFVDGFVVLRGVTARHGETSIWLDGRVESSPDGAWHLSLSELEADRVFATHDFVSALPRKLGRLVTKLNVSGPVHLGGSFQLSGIRGEQAVRSSQWDLELDLENGSIECGAKFDHIHGGVHLRGGFGPRGLSCDGLINVDSAVLNGVQLTRVQGPLTLRQDRMDFGLRARPSPFGQQSRPIFGRALGGVVATSGNILFDEARFELEAALRDGDLAVISRETTSRRHEISGRANGAILLSGAHRGLHTLTGQGNLQLREADIYQLPVMVRLLKLLSIHRPDKTAFTSSDLVFRLEGDHVYFDRIDFDGDAISLEGKGEMDFERALNLTFDTSVGRDADQFLSLLLRPLLKEAGRRLMAIRVTGTLRDPLIEQVALPDFNESIQQVFPETPRASPTANSRQSPFRVWQ